MTRPSAVASTIAPCLECMRLWSREQLTADLRMQWILAEADTTVWYVHPDCLRHPALLRTPPHPLLPSPYGPIRTLYRKATLPGAPFIAIALAREPDGAPLTAADLGRGVDFDPNTAEQKALMEAIERRCAQRPPRAPLRYGSAAEFEGLLAADAWSGTDGLRWWCVTRELGSDKDRLVPLEYVGGGGGPAAPDVPARIDTTGMAVYSDREHAVDTAISEALERVGVARLLQRQVDCCWESLDRDAHVARIVACCRARGYEVLAFGDEPVDGFTAAVVLLHRASHQIGPALACGSGGGWEVETALRRALFEAYAQLVNAEEVWTPDGGAQAFPKLASERFRWYHYAEHAKALLVAWGVLAAPRRPPPSAARHRGYGPSALPPGFVLLIDRGNPLTDSLGLSAVQALVPSLARPELSQRLPAFGLPSPFT